MDPAEAIDALLEELYRQKAVGVKRVNVSEESIQLLKDLASGRPQSNPINPSSSSQVAPSMNRPATPASKKVEPMMVSDLLPNPPVLKLPSGTKAEQLLWLQKIKKITMVI